MNKIIFWYLRKKYPQSHCVLIRASEFKSNSGRVKTKLDWYGDQKFISLLKERLQ